VKDIDIHAGSIRREYCKLCKGVFCNETLITVFSKATYNTKGFVEYAKVSQKVQMGRSVTINQSNYIVKLVKDCQQFL
jgi:hypothetical protein